MKAGIIAVLAIVVIGAGVFFFLSQQPKAPETSITTQKTSTEDKIVVENTQTIDSNLQIGSDTPEATSGSYQEYSELVFNSGKDKKRVLFFYASWCPTCRPADADFTANASRFPKDLAVFRVNYNDSDTDAADKALAAKYGIAYQHTFIEVNNKGNEIKKWNGGGLSKLFSEVNKQPSPSPLPPEKQLEELF